MTYTPKSPLTDSENVTLIKTYRCEEIEEIWNRDFEFDTSKEFEGFEEIELYECKDTGLRFFHPFEAEGSAAFYEGMQKTNGYYYDHEKWEFRKSLDWLPRNEKVLEIGSGNGVFLKIAKQEGYSITGIEINNEAVKAAEQAGLPIQGISLTQAVNVHAESCSAICSFQVLEHVAHPRGFIENMLKLLKPGGLLLVSTPNLAGYLRLYQDTWDLPPHHMSRWTPSTFKSLERILPIKLEKLLYEPLSAVHMETFLEEYTKHFSLTRPSQRLALNYTTLPIVRKLFKWGLRKCFHGHAILGVFRKLS
ncbi:class I SAM-dependent methyltransferase [bacterium]|nr:class I SAM-dependent methyltransferase [bacterium]